MGIGEWVDEVRATPWPPLHGFAALGAASFVFALLMLSSTDDHWVPVLDHANLAFHEAGHPLFGLMSRRLAVYGGTIMQLAIPLAAAISFWARRHTLGFVLSIGWTCQSLLNVAAYMGDARAMALPLIGGLDPELHHDWREIFTRWGMLELDTAWAGLNKLIAWSGGLGISVWGVRRWRASDSA